MAARPKIARMKAIWFALTIFVGIFNIECRFFDLDHQPSFKLAAIFPAKFTCNGTNVSPELQISSVPE